MVRGDLIVLSEGDRYQDLLLASADLQPRSAAGALADGLDGWTFMMRTADRTFALLYFENNAGGARLHGFTPNTRYRWTWFDPRHGAWLETAALTADANGILVTPAFPDVTTPGARDIAAKILVAP